MFPFKKILCPTDFSEPSLCGLRMAEAMAATSPAEIIVVNVHKPIPHLPTPRLQAPDVVFDISAYEKIVAESAQESLAQFCDGVFEAGATVRLEILMGRPADEILRFAEEENVDAIVMGTHGRTGLAHIVFGRVAEKVVRSAKCPVLTIRSCN